MNVREYNDDISVVSDARFSGASDFSIENIDEFCIENGEFCIENDDSALKILMNSALKILMNSALKILSSALKILMNSALKMMNSALKMVNSARLSGVRKPAWTDRTSFVLKYNRFALK